MENWNFQKRKPNLNPKNKSKSKQPPAPRIDGLNLLVAVLCQVMSVGDDNDDQQRDDAQTV